MGGREKEEVREEEGSLGRMGPGQLGPQAQLSGAQLSARHPSPGQLGPGA